jgi:cob(I)alamin adenosyltransferase
MKKIYTKTGDKGDTSLFSGERKPKYDTRIHLYGTIDELLAVITLALEFNPPAYIVNDLNHIRKKIFQLNSDLATLKNSPYVTRIQDTDVAHLEQLIDKYTAELPELKSFIMPGGNQCSAFLNFARTICRRAERIAVELKNKEYVNENAMLFMNRLSDYLFTAMRYCNK